MCTDIQRQLDAFKVGGNAMVDEPLFVFCHHVLMGDNTDADKLAALQKIDDAMGIGDVLTMEDVEIYIDSFLD